MTLPPACLDATRDAGDAYAQVTVDGTALPRQKLGATPYALVARDAQQAELFADSASAVEPNGVSQAVLQDGAVSANKLDPAFVARVTALEAAVDALETPSSRAAATPSPPLPPRA